MNKAMKFRLNTDGTWPTSDGGEATLEEGTVLTADPDLDTQLSMGPDWIAVLVGDTGCAIHQDDLEEVQ